MITHRELLLNAIYALQDACVDYGAQQVPERLDHIVVRRREVMAIVEQYGGDAFAPPTPGDRPPVADPEQEWAHVLEPPEGPDD